MRPALLTAVALLAGALVTAQGPAPIAQGPPRENGSRSCSWATPARREATDPKAGGWYHDSDRFAPMLKAALATYGFNFSYTTDAADLNAANLAKYDALLIYANHRRSRRRRRRRCSTSWPAAKGFCRSTPRRSASRTRRRTSRWSARSSSGTAPASSPPTFVNPSHPVMAGLQPFQTWDETYVHTKINPDRTVLMERVEGERPRAVDVGAHAGKGPRVLHGVRARRADLEPAELPRRSCGTRFSGRSGRRVRRSSTQLAIAPLQYTDGAVPVPNYERRNPRAEAAGAALADEAAKHIQIPPGFELQLFASEPLITGNPEAMAWDERGRLWIAETKDYPNNLQPAGQGHDDIKILEDTNHDGRADKVDGLRRQAEHRRAASSSPTAGSSSSQAGEFIFLRTRTATTRPTCARR